MSTPYTAPVVAPGETDITLRPEDWTDIEVRQCISQLLDKTGIQFVRTAGDPELRG